jgi:uncharacterized protein YbgA (DUF1722 family)
MPIDKLAVVPKDAVDYLSKVDLRILESRPDHYRTTGAVKRTRRMTLRKFARRYPNMTVTRIKEYLKYASERKTSWDQS